MKKRILSIALALVMLLSFALVSCKKEETPPPAPQPKLVDTYKFFDKISYSPEQKTQSPTQLIGSYAPAENSYEHTSYGDITVYRSSVYETVEVEGVPTEKFVGTLYEIIFFSTGTKQEILVPSTDGLTDEQLKTTITGVDFNFRNAFGYYFLSVTARKGYGNEYDHTLYSEAGFALAEIKGDDSSSVNFNYSSNNIRTILYGDTVYRADCDEESISLTKVIDGSYDAMRFISNCEYENGMYIYMSYDVYQVFDESFKQIAYFDFEQVESGEVEISRLENGNLYIQEIIPVLNDAAEYDFYFAPADIKVIVNAYLYDVTSGELKATDKPEYFGQIMTIEQIQKETEDLVITINDPAVKAFMSNAIWIHNQVCYTSKVLALDADMKPLYFLEMPFSGDFYLDAHNAGTLVAQTPIELYYADGNANKLAPFSYNDDSNEKWIITNKGVYDNKLTLVYDYASANREIYEVLADSILFREETEVEGVTTEKYILWTGVGAESVIATDDEIDAYEFFYDYFYKEVWDDSGIGTLSMYGSNGTSLATISGVWSFYTSQAYHSEASIFDIELYDADTDTYSTIYYTIK